MKLLTAGLYFIESLLVFIFSYAVFAYIFSAITINNKFTETEDGITIYILSNGVHTDIVAPLKNEFIDWSKSLNPADTLGNDKNYNWVSFGWGDKGFYLDTPTWSDLKFSTAFKAAFALSTTAMHVSFYRNLKQGELCKKVVISEQQYLKLVELIKDSFKESNPIRIPNASYGANDSFYDAKGTYNFFKTCNTWANSTLKNAGLKACLWTPLDKFILNKY